MGIKLYSLLEPSDDGITNVAYVRALVNAGVSLHWVPLVLQGQRYEPVHPGPDLPASLQWAHDDAALADLGALMTATAQPRACDTVLVHAPPEVWPQFFEPGKRNVGYTACDADALPPHWKPLLDQAQVICVPSEMNRSSFVAEGLHAPVRVVPPIRRQVWNDAQPSEQSTMREALGIAADDFVFYSVGRWSAINDHELLLRAYLKAFDATDPVALILKTSPQADGPAPFYDPCPAQQLAESIMGRLAEQQDAPLAKVSLLPYELSGRGVDLLHALGDCYVSTSHGAGWSMAAFDAATRGTPLVMPAWGAALDYLGEPWPGALPFKLGAVPVYPPHEPSFWPPQRWANVDLDGTVRALRDVLRDPQAARAAAARRADDIASRFAETVVVQQLLSALEA